MARNAQNERVNVRIAFDLPSGRSRLRTPRIYAMRYRAKIERGGARRPREPSTTASGP